MMVDGERLPYQLTVGFVTPTGRLGFRQTSGDKKPPPSKRMKAGGGQPKGLQKSGPPVIRPNERGGGRLLIEEKICGKKRSGAPGGS